MSQSDMSSVATRVIAPRQRNNTQRSDEPDSPPSDEYLARKRHSASTVDSLPLRKVNEGCVAEDLRRMVAERTLDRMRGAPDDETMEIVVIEGAEGQPDTATW